MWAEGEALTPRTLPTWLDLDDAHLYRRVAAGVPSVQERGRLELAGLVVDHSGIYVPDQSDQQVFSIGLATGRSPHELNVSHEPCLTRDDVSDVTAHHVADPFMLRREGRWFMFFEVWDWHAVKGAIALAVSDDGLKWGYEQVVLAEAFHLSFPYIFEWAGEAYLVPESARAGALWLYRASRFPWHWERVAELLTGEDIVDATPFRAGDRWWLLGGAGENDKLRLFFADDLLGPWREHPASPVVDGDPVRARPAGRVLADSGRLIRFAQRCDDAYGLDVRAHEIIELTPTHYAERELGVVLAGGAYGWNARGMHHVDLHKLGSGSWLACVDGWRAAGTPA
jgi:hypothetical protein